MQGGFGITVGLGASFGARRFGITVDDSVPTMQDGFGITVLAPNTTNWQHCLEKKTQMIILESRAWDSGGNGVKQGLVSGPIVRKR